MLFINSSRLRQSGLSAVKAAGEALAVSALTCSASVLVWSSPTQKQGVFIGVFAAWLVSSVSSGTLIAAKAVSVRAFWWAFGAGLALRLFTLLALMALTVYRSGPSPEALLLSYAFGVLGCLLIEYRRIKLK